MRDASVLVPERRRCRRDAALRRDVSASTLLHGVNRQLYLSCNILSLSYLRRVLQAVCLLNEEHVAVVVRGLHDLRARSPVLDVRIGMETLI